MPYQDTHSAGAVTDATMSAPLAEEAPVQGGEDKRVQIIIVLGLVAAIVAALFGNF